MLSNEVDESNRVVDGVLQWIAILTRAIVLELKLSTDALMPIPVLTTSSISNKTPFANDATTSSSKEQQASEMDNENTNNAAADLLLTSAKSHTPLQFPAGECK